MADRLSVRSDVVEVVQRVSENSFRSVSVHSGAGKRAVPRFALDLHCRRVGAVVPVDELYVLEVGNVSYWLPIVLKLL